MDWRKTGLAVLCGAVVTIAAATIGFAADANAPSLHQPLADDGIHDPSGPGLQFLQQPGSALDTLPQDRAGNHVNWVEAIRGHYVEPRKGIKPDANMNVINMDVQMSKTASMPEVKFPHKAHTEWLGCNNCHPAIFLPQKDGNPISMYAILKGEFCGVCHGKVAFPVADCFRCHNTPGDPRKLNR
jgi:c(7)-type cytochrome triheme protein